jgi:hypothetical protein
MSSADSSAMSSDSSPEKYDQFILLENKSRLRLVGSSIVCSETVYLTRVIVIPSYTSVARTFFSREIILIKLNNTIRDTIVASAFFPPLETTNDQFTQVCPQLVHVLYTYTTFLFNALNEHNCNLHSFKKH